MNKKGISALVVVAIVVIAVVVVGVVAYYALSSGGDNGGGGNGGETVITIQNATSLSYDADVTSQGSTITYEWAGRNIGSDTLEIRVDLLGGESGNYSYILNAGDQTAWAGVNDEWTDVSSDFANQWAAWGATWTENLDALQADWSGTGDFQYTASNGDEITIHNIALNPELADSLFQPPA
jgi:hypothetical protein